MRYLAAKSLVFSSALALLLAACGDNDKDPPDAQVPDGPPAPEVDAGAPDAAPLPVPVFILSGDAITVNEGNAAGTTFSVKLSSAPGQTLTVAVTSSDDGVALASSLTLTFDDTNFGTEQTVTVTAVDDVDGNNETGTITLSAPGLADATVAMSIIDDDSLNILADPTTLTVDEGGAATFAVRLTIQPNADVTVNVVSSDEDAATAEPVLLTFTQANYAEPQTVTVTGEQDADGNDEAVTFTLSATDLADVGVSVSVRDDDSQRIVAEPTSLTIGEGNTASFEVRLTVEPNADVTVNIVSDDDGAASTPTTSLTFTPANYDQPQTVTVTGEQDADGNDENAVLTLSSDGLDNVGVNVTVEDEDVQSLVAAPAAVTVAEGDNATFTVRLTVEPNADVTVDVASDDEDAASVSPTTLTFTQSNYNEPQTVTVTGEQDADGNDEDVTLTVSSEGVANVEVDVTVEDEDVQSLAVEPTSLTVTELDTATFTVNLTVQPNNNVTVTVGSSDTGAATVSPASLTFTPANYNQPRTVTVAGVNDPDGNNESVTLTVASSGLPNVTVDTSVVDNDILNIAADPTTLSVNEGGTATFGVSLTVQPNNNVTVTVASSDTGAASVSASSLTFTPANYDQAQTVTVTGVQDEDVADESVTVTLSATGVAPVDVAVAVDDNDTQTILLSRTSLALDETQTGTFTVQLSNDPLGSFEVAVTSGDVGAVSVTPTTLTFTSANYTQPQTVTVRAEADDDARDESVAITLSAADVANATVAVTVTDPTPPYPVDMFVRGSFNGFGVNRQLVQQGPHRYTALVPLDQGSPHQFKIADANFTNETTFSVSATDAVAINLNQATTLQRAPGVGNQTLLTITQPGVYLFELTVNDPAAPVLRISLSQAAPYNVDMFVHFLSPAAPAQKVFYQGNNRYEVVLPLARAPQNFLIGDAARSTQTTFSINATNARLITPGTPTPLVRVTGPNAAIILTVDPAGTYRFELNATSATAPVLTVTRLP